MADQPNPHLQDPADVGTFKANTRKQFESVMCYMASLHQAWIPEENHSRISQNSSCYLQASREDLEAVANSLPIDAEPSIFTIVIDCTTDTLHFHLCKPYVPPPTETKGAAKGATKPASGTKDAPHPMAEHFLDEEEPSEDTLNLAAALSTRKTKDAVPLQYIAEKLTQLTRRLGGKPLHAVMTGCNTCGIALPLKALIPEELHAHVWLLCTNEVWPGDLSTFLWHHYGATVQNDLEEFRLRTRTLIDQFTPHWKRQRVEDQSMNESARKTKSLSLFVLCDRLDRVRPGAGGFPEMSLL